MGIKEYRVDLTVDVEAERYEGVVGLTLDRPASELELDCVGLEVHGAAADRRPVPAEVDRERGRLRLALGAPPASSVEVRFSGAVRRNVTNGFYVSRFGESKLLTTMMEPIGCRRFIPCDDRPDAKAVFRLRVRVPAGVSVISNADLAEVRADDGGALWSFEPTPPMSTYLLYLGVGPFDLVEVESGGIRAIAAAAPGKAARSRTILDLAGPILHAYGEYYGLRYPLSKLHLVAVPDFWAGGMENWGAITLPEIGLLVDAGTSPAIRRWAYETVTHEIAHQWFGNLVTMRTFDDLWLNESFTTFVAAKMEDRLHLRHDAWAEFLIRSRPGGFVDSLRCTHPIRMPTSDPSAISESIDAVTYYKGSNIVRMIEAYLGEEVFRRGLSAYLRRFQFANATSDDLWEALGEASGEPVRRVMRAWVERPGLPVVRVTREGAELRLEQRRFTFLPDTPAEPPWPIPLVYEDADGPHALVFDAPRRSVPLRDPAALRVNPGHTGFFRTWYAPELRRARIERLPEIPPFDRWGFMNDAAAFALSGDYPLGEFLEAVRRVRDVHDYATVLEVIQALSLFDRTLGPRSPVREVALEFLRAQRLRLGERARDGEPDIDPVLREAVLLASARLDDAFSRELARGFDEVDRADAAVRSATALAFARFGGDSAGERLFERATAAESEDAAEQACRAMEGLPHREQHERVLARLFHPELRTTLTTYLLGSIGANPEGRGPLWGWLRSNLREFERRAEGSWLLSVLLESAIPTVGLERPDEVRAYFAREVFPEGRLGIQKGLELLEVLERLRGRGAAGGTDPGAPAPERSPPAP